MQNVARPTTISFAAAAPATAAPAATSAFISIAIAAAVTAAIGAAAAAAAAAEGCSGAELGAVPLLHCCEAGTCGVGCHKLIADVFVLCRGECTLIFTSVGRVLQAV